MPLRCTAREHFDDDHATAAAWTARLVGIDSGSCGLTLGFCSSEQRAGAGDVAGASAFGDSPSLDAVVLPFERDAALVTGDQAAVGNGDAMGVTRQIGQ